MHLKNRKVDKKMKPRFILKLFQVYEKDYIKMKDKKETKEKLTEIRDKIFDDLESSHLTFVRKTYENKKLDGDYAFLQDLTQNVDKIVNSRFKLSLMHNMALNENVQENIMTFFYYLDNRKIYEWFLNQYLEIYKKV